MASNRVQDLDPFDGSAVYTIQLPFKNGTDSGAAGVNVKGAAGDVVAEAMVVEDSWLTEAVLVMALAGGAGDGTLDLSLENRDANDDPNAVFDVAVNEIDLTTATLGKNFLNPNLVGTLALRTTGTDDVTGARFQPAYSRVRLVIGATAPTATTDIVHGTLVLKFTRGRRAAV